MSETAAAVLAATPAAPEAAPAAPAAPEAAWHAGLDADTSGWLQNRGLHAKDAKAAALDLVQQNRHLEKRLGVPADRLLTLPTNDAEYSALYDKLGRPAKPEEYKLPVADNGADKPLAEALSPAFHAAGLNNKQAEAVYKAVTAFAMNEAKTEIESADTAAAAQMAALKEEWKDLYDVNVNLARSVVRRLGVDEATIEALEAAIGNSAAVIKLFAAIGQKSGQEAGFVSGAGGFSNAPTTPDAARQRLSELTRDPAFARRYAERDAEASALVTNLTKIASGMRPA